MVQIIRKKIIVGENQPSVIAAEAKPALPVKAVDLLVVNSSREMAKEITMQIGLTLEGASITYAPTVEVAKLILRRREFHLVIASPMLPDGGVDRLRSELERVSNPPDLVVVGAMDLKKARQIENGNYIFSAIKRIGQDKPKLQLVPKTSEYPLIIRRHETQPPREEQIKTLGADIRNDLNNPLQEIVAMVFVAKTGAKKNSAEKSPIADQALVAIEKAALAMANVVNGLEDKIRQAVVG